MMMSISNPYIWHVLQSPEFEYSSPGSVFVPTPEDKVVLWGPGTRETPTDVTKATGEVSRLVSKGITYPVMPFPICLFRLR